jgi:DNA-binding MarR family transcriptional regulator
VATARPTQLLHDFLGSAQIFTSAVNDLMEEQLRQVTGAKVTFSQLKLLKMVSLTGGYTVSSVATLLRVSNAAASKAVDRLVRRGLLHRAEAEDDRRAVKLSLTERGRRLLASYDAASSKVLERLLGRLPPEQLRKTAELLDRLSVSIVNRANGPQEVCFRCGIHFRERCLLQESVGRNCHFHVHKGGANDGYGRGGKGSGNGSG